MGWLLDILRWLWDVLRGWPRAPVITAIRADPAVVVPGGTSTISVSVRGGRPPYTYAAEATAGRIEQIGDGVVRWRDA